MIDVVDAVGIVGRTKRHTHTHPVAFWPAARIAFLRIQSWVPKESQPRAPFDQATACSGTSSVSERVVPTSPSFQRASRTGAATGRPFLR